MHDSKLVAQAWHQLRKLKRCSRAPARITAVYPCVPELCPELLTKPAVNATSNLAVLKEIRSS